MANRQLRRTPLPPRHAQRPALGQRRTLPRDAHLGRCLGIQALRGVRPRNRTPQRLAHGAAAVSCRRHLRRAGQPDAVRTLPGPGDAAPRKTAGRLGDRLPGADQDAHQGQNGSNRWSWCDALFMAPPVYALLANVTGDNGYREFMNREFTPRRAASSTRPKGFTTATHAISGKREKNGEKRSFGAAATAGATPHWPS